MSEEQIVNVQMMQASKKPRRWEPGELSNMKEDSGWKPDPTADLVNHPPHYNAGEHEVYDVLQDWSQAGMISYGISNVIKYCARYQLKGKPLQDLRKARWYLDKEIARYENEG